MAGLKARIEETPVIGKLYYFSKRIALTVIDGIGLLKIKDNVPLDKEIIVLGNGPSINEDFDKIIKNKAERDIMCVNSFVVGDYFTILKPNYYVFADPSLFEEVNDERDKLIQENIYKGFSEKLSWPMTLVVPIQAKGTKVIDRIAKNPYVKIEYLSTRLTQPFFFNKFKLFNKNLLVPRFQNVLIACIYYCIYRKYKTVYIFGADHSWFKTYQIDINNHITNDDTHFYDKKKVNVISDSQNNIVTLLESLIKAFREYYVLEKYSIFNKVKVYNETEKSFIDAFERRSGTFD